MPESGTPSFWLRLGEKVLPGTQIGQDGQRQNIGRGLLGLGARVGASFLGGPLAGMAAGKLAGRVVDSNFARGGGASPRGNQLGFGSQGMGGNYSFYNQAGANPYSQLGSGYQFPRQTQSPQLFGPQQSIWSFQGDPYAQPSNQPAPSSGGAAGGEDGGGCVTVDSVLPSHDRADSVKVGDFLEVVDAKTLEHSIAKVSYSESMPQPCVLVRTANGVELECSESAPIANAEGEQILSINLKGHKVPTVVDGRQLIDLVTEVEPIGERMVQKITCENRFFLAGKTKGRYLLHHNVKAYGGKNGATFSQQANGGSFNLMPNWAGLKWGW